MKKLPLGCVCILLLLTAAFSAAAQAPVCHSLTASGLTYSQDFNTLAMATSVSGPVMVSEPLPAGFGFSEAGTNANNTYTAATGSSSAGETYSYGSNGSTDRAFGSVRASALNTTIGACFVNNTGMNISGLAITYDGEMWRAAVTGRSDRVDFQYSLDATSLTDGTWTDVNALDFVGPVPASTGSKIGNDSANRVAGITSTISSLSIANGSSFYIRFLDVDISGSDDGLAIDNFSLTATIPVKTVTKTADTNDGSCSAADCSLREAIAAAVSNDTIAFASPLFDSAQTITLTLGTEIAVSSKNLTITGPGADKLTIDGGAGSNRIFLFDSSDINLTGMKLTGGGGSGVVDGAGGAILALGTPGTITLDGLHFTGNSAVNGGALYVGTGMARDIRNSTFSGNTASNYGGAIAFTASNAPTTVSNTTVSGNTAPNGAIVRFGGPEDLIIQNSTITGNTGTTAGGIYAEGSVRLGGSIVAGNTGTYPEIYQAAAYVVSDGYNLVGDSAGDSASTNFAVSYASTDIRDTDPQLGALGYNVGATPVHTPAAGSPVIDKGSAFGATTDQRGSSRTYDNPSVTNASGGDGTDIGSVELPGTLAGEVAITGRVADAYGRPIRGAEVIVQGGGVARRVLTNQFGFFRVSGLEAGEAYSVAVSAKRHKFAAATRTVTPQDNVAGIDFTAQP